MLALTTALLLASSPTLPTDAPTVGLTSRQARLLAASQPSAPLDLAGRALLAPVLGVAGAGLGGALGLLGGGLIGSALSLGWTTLGLAVLGSAVLGVFGLVCGTVIGSSLFGDFKDLLGRSVPIALLVLGLAVVGGVAALVALWIAELPVVGIAAGVGVLAVGAAAVPLLVEAARVNAPKPEQRAPDATVPVAAF